MRDDAVRAWFRANPSFGWCLLFELCLLVVVLILAMIIGSDVAHGRQPPPFAGITLMGASFSFVANAFALSLKLPMP